MRKKLSNGFYVILMVALLWVAFYGLLLNRIRESQKTEALDSYAETTLLDVNNNKIVDSLEKDIERDPSQKVNVIIQYDAGRSFYRTQPSSSNLNHFK